MSNRLQKQPEVTFVPAVRHVEARAAFCNTPPRKKGGIFGSGGGSSRTVTEEVMVWPQSGMPYITTVTNTFPPTPSFTSSYSPSCYPAIKGVQGVTARIDKFESNGWNGGARSIIPVPANGYFEVDLRRKPIGIMVGLSGGSPEYSYSHLDIGIVSRPDGLGMVANGADIGITRPTGTKVRIERRADGDWYFLDGEFLYKTATGSSGTMYAYSALYSNSDYVENPVIGGFRTPMVSSEFAIETYIDAKAGGICTLVIETVAMAVVDGVIQASGSSAMAIRSGSSAFARTPSSGVSTLEVLASYHGHTVLKFGPDGIPAVSAPRKMNYAQGRMRLSGIAAFGAFAKASGYFSKPSLVARINRPEATEIEAIGAFSRPTLSSHLLNGGVLRAENTLGMAGKGSELAFFGGQAHAATIYELMAWEAYLHGGLLDGGEVLFVESKFALDSIVMFALHDGVEVSDGLDLYLLLNLEAYEHLNISATTSFASIIELAISERVAITSATNAMRSEALQYAVNAITGALSLYENFGFKQFATADGRTYAVSDSSLYELKGATDNGSPLNASIDFGANDFGTSQSKRVSSVYAGIDTDGEVYLRVTGDNGEELVYKAIGYGNESRAVTAKGISARHWRLRLELTNATVADLDNTEIEIGVSKRRLKGGR